MIVEHNQTSTGRCPFGEHIDAPLEGRCGEMTQIEGRGPTIHIPLHISQHPNGIRENEQLLLEEYKRMVRRDHTTWL